MLSCPNCFIQLCYDSQRHETYENQYRSVCVRNVKINTTKLINPIEEDSSTAAGNSSKNFRGESIKKNRRKNVKKPKPQAVFAIKADEDLSQANLEELRDKIDKQKEAFLIYFSTECEHCGTEVAAYELNDKTYHFFNVIPSLS